MQESRADFVVVALEEFGAEEVGGGQPRRIGEPEVLAGRLIHVRHTTFAIQHADEVSGPLERGLAAADLRSRLWSSLR